MGATIPISTADVLLHNKNSDRTERVILPYTRYSNVMNAPKIVKNAYSAKGSPFSLLITDTEELTTEEIRVLSSGIV